MKKHTDTNTEGTKEKTIVGNYEKHPFFVKKNNAAKDRLDKVGLPENYKVIVSKNHN